MKIGMLFPGYGSQFVGMAKDLYDDSRTVQEYFEEASSCLDINFIKLCFASSDAEISQPMHAYLSLFLVQSALSALLTKAGIAPTLVAGYGIGQFAAIHSAKGFTFPDGLYVLKKYAQFYEETLETLNGAVIKVTGMTQEDLEKSLALVKATKTLAIAAYNTPTEFIVSGEAEDVETLRELLSKKKKVKVKSVDQAFGLHSNLMDSVVEQLSLYLGKVDFKELNTPLSNNVNAEISAQPEDTKKAVISQIFSPLLWDKSIDNFKDVDVLIQVGPGKEFEPLVRERYPDKKFVTLSQKSDIEALKEIFPEVELDLGLQTVSEPEE